MNDKDLAEFIIDLAQKHSDLDDFKRVLGENGAEFADSFVKNLHRIIKHMKPAGASNSDTKPTDTKPTKSSKLERLAESMPFLATTSVVVESR